MIVIIISCIGINNLSLLEFMTYITAYSPVPLLIIDTHHTRPIILIDPRAHEGGWSFKRHRYNLAAAGNILIQ